MAVTITRMGPIIMTTETHGALYRLMSWLSPSYPVGAFSYSQGLETAIAEGRVTTAHELSSWLEDVAAGGMLWSDAVIFARAYDAAARSQWTRLAEIADFAIAFQSSAELKQETSAQGAAFLQVTTTTWSCHALHRLANALAGPCPYAVAVATAAAGHEVPAGDALVAFVHAAAANLVSAAMRLVPLGQTDGQRVIAALQATLSDTVARARSMPLDGLSTNCLVADIMAMRHETQHTRLFRS